MELSDFEATTDDVAYQYARAPRNQQTNRRSGERDSSQTQLDLPRHSKGERFIRGPIPLDRLRLAATCGHSAGLVGVLLWYEAGWQKANPVKLTASDVKAFGIHPKTAKRCLVKMESIGLVSAEFHRGRSPLVTIKPFPPRSRE